MERRLLEQPWTNLENTKKYTTPDQRIGREASRSSTGPNPCPLPSSHATYTPGGVLGSGFAGYVPLASQNPYPIIVYSVAGYRPHFSHFWANVIVISRTEFNAS